MEHNTFRFSGFRKLEHWLKWVLLDGLVLSNANKELFFKHIETALFTLFTNANEEKLGNLDSRLKLKGHISSLCRKAGQKINALARLNNNLRSNKFIT